MKFKKIEPKQASRQTFILFAFIVVMLTVFIAEGFNRLDYAKDQLTTKDLTICLEDINSMSYIKCWTYLTETNQKDLSALWLGKEAL